MMILNHETPLPMELTKQLQQHFFSGASKPQFQGAGITSGKTNPFKALPPATALEHIGTQGSCFAADGGKGRVIPGGMHTQNGIVGANFQVFG